jgi:hypothetical protein
MSVLNRSVAIIRVKQPYVDWANSIPDEGEETNTAYLEEMRSDSTVFLLPDLFTNIEAINHIEKIYKQIFEYKLWSWCPSQKYWPKDITWNKFIEWFDLEFHTEVIDATAGPIELDPTPVSFILE